MNPLGDTPEPARGSRFSPFPAAFPAALAAAARALRDQLLELGLLGGEGVGLGGEGGDPLVEDGFGRFLALLQLGHGGDRRHGVGGPFTLPVPGGGERLFVPGQLGLRLGESGVGVVVLRLHLLHQLAAPGHIGQVARQRQELAGEVQVIERAALAAHVGHHGPAVEDLLAVRELHLQGGDVGADLGDGGRGLVGVGSGIRRLGLAVGQVGGDLLQVPFELGLRRLCQVEVAANLLRPPLRLVTLALEVTALGRAAPLGAQRVGGGGEEQGGAQSGGQRPSLLQHDPASLTRL
jgi:hypothetical protein